MGASDHLNPQQFRYTHEALAANIGGGTDHRMRVYQGAGKKPLGSIRWDTGSGEVKALGVQEEHQGNGIATKLWDRASEHSAENGLAIPKHSPEQLPDGAKWAAAEEARKTPDAISGQQPLFPRKGANATRTLKE
jgi:GNAT superfamily N-acetyltransferase